MNDKATTIAEIISAATDAGDWVNGSFSAIVRNAKAPQGNKPSKADFVDPNDPGAVATGCWFGGNLLDHEGGIVEVGGKGNKSKNYRGRTEINIGNNGTLRVVQAGSPRTQQSPPAGGAAPQNRPANNAPAATPAEEEKRFHAEMKRIGLLWFHSWQYSRDVVARLPDQALTSEMEQSLISSLFITAKERGLLNRPPAPRAMDDKDHPLPFVPAKVEESAEAKAERERKAKEELDRKHREEEERRKNEELDEDVPF